MKHLICLFSACVFPTLLFAQFTDDFSDGNFTQNPTWSGDTSYWKINNFQLESNGPAITYSYIHLYTPSALARNAKWEFYADPKLATSSGNYIDVYLISDSSNLNGNGNGYFVRIGNTDDEVSLYKKINGSSTKIIDGKDHRINSSSDNPTRVLATRDSNSLWTLSDDTTGTGNLFVEEGTISDSSVNTSSYFGILLKYSSSNAMNFFFDDFDVEALVKDTTPPKIAQVIAVNANHLDVYFNEPMNSYSLKNTTDYSVNEEIDTPATASPDISNPALVHLDFSSSFQPQKIYTISISNVSDVSGNVIVSNSTSSFQIPDTIEPNDIVVNEILYNPKSNGVDYIEIYNRSQKKLDLSQLQIANVDANDSVYQIDDVTDESYPFLPGRFAALTTDTQVVLQQYPVHDGKAMIQLKSLPTFYDNAGSALLITKRNLRIDELHYTDAWQFPLITNTEGVALERVNPDAPTQDSMNWHSAASTVDYGTPGLPNSQFLNDSLTNKNPITVSPKVFSPDEDGYNDILSIAYNFDKPGYVLNVTIFNDKGKVIRQLVRNETSSQKGTFTWDGTDDNRSIAQTGIYIIYTEIFSLSGKASQFKNTCVLASKR
jgi:hypothetical protein